MIKLIDINKEYVQKGSKVLAVKNANLEVQKGEIYGIIGYSGAGKSTMVRLFNLLEKPTTGEILFNDKSLTKLSDKDLRAEQQQIGMIFQHFNLLWSRTVLENIKLPMELAGKSKEEMDKKANELIKLVGLDGKENFYPSELSGGQKQRVGIARALANDPKMILADEATSALDPQTTDQILDLLVEINQKLELTIVLITHEMHVIKRICHKVAVMEAGEIVEKGTVMDVFHDPQAQITKRFLNQIDDDDQSEIVINNFKEKYPNSTTYSLRFIAEDIEAPIVSTMARKFPESRLHVLHVSTVPTQDGTYAKMTLQVIGNEDLQKAVREHLDSTYNVTMEVI
ncbi:MAG: ATP-binding cassette domain-containing protein [Leptotrichiaceae bacterium]